MKSEIAILAAIAGLTGRAAAQSAAYGQCGGVNWTGSKSCVSGYTCTYSNPYYSQCLPGGNGNNGGTVTVTVTTTTISTKFTTVYSTTTTTETETETDTVTVTEDSGTGCSATTTGDIGPTGACDPSDGTKFQYFGVNQAGAEFGTAIPGRLDKDYTWPSPSSIDYFLAHGLNTFRIPTLMERIAPPATGISGDFNQTYLVGLYQIVSYIVSNGGYAIIDVHNYGRYNGAIIKDVSAFGNFWAQLAGLVSWSPNIIFDLMNEYHDMDQQLVWQLNQAGISAIRSTGATNLILVEGNSWTGAWTWTTVNADTLIYLFDPLNNFAYEMHQYLDSDGSGSHEECVSDTIGVERLTDATNWCLENNVKCFLGELGTGTGDTCTAALEGALCYMKSSGAWIGFTWWSAGPWWGTYYQSIEPPNGPAFSVIEPILESYA